MAMTLKKTRHPGVYRRSDGGYQLRAAIKRNGKFVAKKKVMPAGTSLSEAMAAMAELKMAAVIYATHGHRPQIIALDRSETVEDYIEKWLDVKKKRLKEAAYVSYEGAMVRKVTPRIGHIRCIDVRRGMVESWVAWAEGLSKANGKPYSQGAMRSWWRPMAAMLRDLSADYDISDPTRRVRPPEAPEVPMVRETKTLSIEGVQQLLADALELTPDRYPEIATLACTGMRAGELHALKWDAVDFERGEITIRRSISMGVLKETTKTKAWRSVPLAPMLAGVLKAHRQVQLAGQVNGLRQGLIFPSRTGTVRSTGSLKKAFVALMAAHDYGQRIGPQVLRRTFNTLLLSSQVDQITIRAMMGHTSAAMTQRYAGVRMEEKRSAVVQLFG